MTTEAPKSEPTELVKELRLIRSILFALLVLFLCSLTFTVVTLSMPRPASHWQELGAIRDELRQLREELRLHRPPLASPIVVPIKPVDPK